MADPRIRQIKIKTGVVKRQAKEMTMYKKEADDLEAKVEKMKAAGADDHDVRKQTEVLQESKMMIPDTRKRLNIAFEELENMLKAESDLSGAEEYKLAQEMLETAKPALKA